MLERQLRVLRSVCRFTAVLGPPEVFPGLTVPAYTDELPGRGPLGGIYTALIHTRTEFNLCLGCDLPFVQAPFLRFLARRAHQGQADVTVPEAREHGVQPTCAVYRRRALAAIRASLATGENKASGFYHRIRCEVIPWSEIARAGFRPGIFANMNAPVDYEAAERSVKDEGCISVFYLALHPLDFRR